MDDQNTAPSPNETSTTSKVTLSTTVSDSNDESSSKRRPDQALYKPPRRSKNLEVSSPTPSSQPIPVVTTPAPPPPLTSVETSQQNNGTTKPVKTKTARPSLEPYVPPSRRSQPVNKESIPMASNTIEKKSDESEKKVLDNKKQEDQEEEEDDDDWEKILDGNDNSLDNRMIEEIQSKFKESVQIKKPTNDYSQWSVDDFQSKETDLAHIIEVSNFPSTFRTEDLANAFKTLTRSVFDIKWVDETHALIVFPDANTALDALQMTHPMFKSCPMSQACNASKKKVKNASEFLQPYKARPQTSSLTANRQICAALGVRNPMSNNKTKTERQKIETARQQKIREKEEQNLVWDGVALPASPST